MDYRLMAIAICAFGLTACGVSNLAIDDAYHWEDRTPQRTNTSSTTSSTSSDSSTSSSGSDISTSPTTPELEYVSVQDTTITVKIKR